MGFIGITEGAIPFTLVNPLRLVPINMLGGAIASGLGIALGMYDKMPPVGESTASSLLETVGRI